MVKMKQKIKAFTMPACKEKSRGTWKKDFSLFIVAVYVKISNYPMKTVRSLSNLFNGPGIQFRILTKFQTQKLNFTNEFFSCF